MKLDDLHRKRKKKGGALEKRFKQRTDSSSLSDESLTTTLLNQIFQTQTLPDTASAPDIRGQGRQL